jgi:thiamine-phosphate pyrophosphorylase
LLLYYITDRTQFPGDEAARRRRLLDKIAEAARAGVDYIQLREKDIPLRELESLARAAVRAVQENQLSTGNRQPGTAVLINSRTDVAIASGADGVHLRSQDVSPSDVHALWKCGPGAPARATVGVSCHSPAEVARAAAEGADFTVFAPVFEKKNAANARGLDALHEASQTKIPVLALGGITVENAGACLQAGAAGIAGIRIFQENDIATVVSKLRP